MLFLIIRLITHTHTRAQYKCMHVERIENIPSYRFESDNMLTTERRTPYCIDSKPKYSIQQSHHIALKPEHVDITYEHMERRGAQDMNACEFTCNSTLE